MNVIRFEKYVHLGCSSFFRAWTTIFRSLHHSSHGISIWFDTQYAHGCTQRTTMNIERQKRTITKYCHHCASQCTKKLSNWKFNLKYIFCDTQCADTRSIGLHSFGSSQADNHGRISGNNLFKCLSTRQFSIFGRCSWWAWHAPIRVYLGWWLFWQAALLCDGSLDAQFVSSNDQAIVSRRAHFGAILGENQNEFH